MSFLTHADINEIVQVLLLLLLQISQSSGMAITIEQSKVLVVLFKWWVTWRPSSGVNHWHSFNILTFGLNSSLMKLLRLMLMKPNTRYVQQVNTVGRAVVVNSIDFFYYVCLFIEFTNVWQAKRIGENQRRYVRGK